MDTCTTLKSVSNHEIYVPLKLRLRFCLLRNYIKLTINDYDNILNFNKCVSDIRAQEHMSEKKPSQMFDWVLNTPLYMEDNRMLLVDFSKIVPKLFLLFAFVTASRHYHESLI